MEKDEFTYKIIGCAMKVHNTMYILPRQKITLLLMITHLVF